MRVLRVMRATSAFSRRAPWAALLPVALSVAVLFTAASCCQTASAPAFPGARLRGEVAGSGAELLGEITVDIQGGTGAPSSITARFINPSDAADGPLRGHVTAARIRTAEEVLYEFTVLPLGPRGFLTVASEDITETEYTTLMSWASSDGAALLLATDIPGMQLIAVPMSRRPEGSGSVCWP